MKSYTAKGIVLRRTDFGEADRILTFLTDDHGKVSVIAKGVRKAKAKLAGSVELFSVSDLVILPGRKDVSTLMSARLIEHFGQIVKDLKRTNCGFELLRLTDKATEDRPEPTYFETLRAGLSALDNQIDHQLVDSWFRLKLLKLGGHSPNLQTDQNKAKLAAGRRYDFDLESMCFTAKEGRGGQFTTDHIKFLRLALSTANPAALTKINGWEKLSYTTAPLVQSMLQAHVRL